MPTLLGIGRQLRITPLTGGKEEAGPVAFFAQSSKGPGLYAVFPAHLLDQTGCLRKMWTFNGHLAKEDRPQTALEMDWDAAHPQNLLLQKLWLRIVVPVLEGFELKNKASDELTNSATPVMVGTKSVGPVLYRSAFDSLSSMVGGRTVAFPALDLAVAFVNPDVLIGSRAFLLPGAEHGLVADPDPLQLAPKQAVRVHCKFFNTNTVVRATIEFVYENNCIFDIVPDKDQPPIEPGFSGAPVTTAPADGVPAMFLGYVVQGENSGKNRTTVVRADAALQHLGTYCPTLGLSLATAESQAVWNAPTDGRASFYQANGVAPQ